MLLDSGLKSIFINALHENCAAFCGITTGRTTGTSCSNSHGTPQTSLAPAHARSPRSAIAPPSAMSLERWNDAG